MTAEQGQTADPRALVPGNPEAIFENVRVLNGRAGSAIAAGEALRRIDTGGWWGKASDRFHDMNQTEVPRWLNGGDTLQKAAESLNGYAECMVWAQGQAREAIALWQQGEEETKQAKDKYNRAIEQANAENQARASRGENNFVTVAPFSDPGEVKRQAARDQLNRAREQLAQVGDGTSQLLHDSAQTAPQDSQKQADANFYGGIWDSVKGFGESLWTLVSDPSATVSAMAYNVTHPVQTLKDLVAWDDWASGHGDRALEKSLVTY
ncbi:MULTISPECIES: putative T7SS-secreted protein [Amycolatopsis]|uniref:Putative T7SS secretion signal domain-containing protein n=1 Tax=Amycolatopsis bullii TaxID=941987 RepID=A0ABQ3KKQ3_9PSEU|nr:hypothetical protein [Amycolatopsis bullii]GHG33359.1 hypothetical protein GCM10017567_62040 [Amycolatopsis bullii]